MRPPAGHWPISELFPHVVVAGCSLACLHCGQGRRAPPPRAMGYGQAVEAFLEAHQNCRAETTVRIRKGRQDVRP